MKPWLILAVAIVAEVIGTTALKASDGLTRLVPAVGVCLGYGISFYFLSIALRSIPVGIAYAVWSGVGILLISLVAWARFGERLDPPALVGIALIISGVLVLNLYSQSVVH